MLMQAFILLATLCANNNVTMCLTVFTLCNTVVSRKYAPPPPPPTFCNLSLSTRPRMGLHVGCDDFFRDYALPSGTGKA